MNKTEINFFEVLTELFHAKLEEHSFKLVELPMFHIYLLNRSSRRTLFQVFKTSFSGVRRKSQKSLGRYPKKVENLPNNF